VTSTRKILMVVGTLVGGVVSSALVATGCGGDDTTSPPGDGGGGDVTINPDAPTEDVVQPVDTGSPPNDGGRDAPTDSPVDAPADAPVDAAPADASAMLAFPLDVARAICNRFASCCTGGGDASASAFDMNLCLGSYGNFGYQGSSEGSNRLANGNVVFDATQAQSCLSQIAAIDCSANLRTSAQEKAIRSACFGALAGKLAAGSPCADAVECAPGLYCTPGGAPANDAGYTGICTALRGTGGACDDFGVTNPNISELLCSYRGSGNTGMTCHNEDYITGVFFDAGAWQCQAQQAVGAGCNVNVDCTSALCDPGADPINSPVYLCTNAEPFIYPFACQTFLKDGG
jgi:hypothetical protein